MLILFKVRPKAVNIVATVVIAARGVVIRVGRVAVVACNKFTVQGKKLVQVSGMLIHNVIQYKNSRQKQ